MLNKFLFILVTILCAVQGMLTPPPSVANVQYDVEWPSYFHGAKLQERAFSPAEKDWARNFPGAVKSFQVGSSQLVMRYVRRPTRSLHSSRDCFRAAGFSVTPLPIRIDQDGARWGCFSAQRGGELLSSCERIYDSNGQSFTDVSAWYWNALIGESIGPWWAVTVIE